MHLQKIFIMVFKHNYFKKIQQMFFEDYTVYFVQLRNSRVFSQFILPYLLSLL